jgi:signal transduction histidine kinase
MTSAIATDLITPLGAYLRLRREGRGSFLLESVEQGRLGRYSFVGSGTRLVYLNEAEALELPVVGYVAYDWVARLEPSVPLPDAGPVLPESRFVVADTLVRFDHVLGIAEAVRVRRERAAEAVRIREEETLRRASEERLRIARELHDALGHHLSLINVQAGVALHVNEGLPDEVKRSLGAIKEASKEGLTELRSVLDILRQEGESAPRSPTPTLARLEDLVAQAAAAGLRVHMETDGEVRPLPFGVDTAAFRIVQESLTNVTRHAGPATATVRLGYDEHELTIQVDDDGRGPGPGTASTGKGVRGMRERVAALGGDLEAGARPGGGFRVRARLPLDGAG